MKLIQKGNSKLHNMYMFNITASKRVCGVRCPGCYAHKEQVRFPTTVLGARQRRFEHSQHPNFDATVDSELRSLRTRPKFFRLHASGEFYSQDYVNSWERIASANPDIVFYTYTKRKKDFDFSRLEALPNFVLIDSLQFGGLNYGSLDSAPKGAFVCPSYKGATCGESCTYCQTKEAQASGVYFKQH